MSELAHVNGPITRSVETLAIIVIAVAIIVGVSGFVSLLGEASTISDLAMAVP